MDDDNDASSNPNAEDHLPVTGEFHGDGESQGDLVEDALADVGDEEDPEESEDDEVSEDDMDLDDPNDMHEVSAEKTDDLEEAPDQDGPADPSATDGSGA